MSIAILPPWLYCNILLLLLLLSNKDTISLQNLIFQGPQELFPRRFQHGLSRLLMLRL